MNAEYRTIEIHPDRDVRNNPLFLRLCSLYPKEDLFFETNNGTLTINLRQLDFRDFQKKILSLTTNAPSQEAELLGSIMTAIEGIRSYGLRGKKRLYAGYNKERKVKDRKGKEQERGKHFYTLGNNFSTTNITAPNHLTDKILVGDSEEVLKQFPDNCVDIIFTSPPYNFGLDYENHQDGTKWDGYFHKLFSVFAECIRVLKHGGRIIVNVQPLFSDYIPLHHIVSDFFMKRKLIWKGEILWDKHNWNCKYTAWGSWKSPSNPYLKYTWEFLEIFSKGDLKKAGDRKNIDITADEFKKHVVAKWDIAPEHRMKKYGHPAMFPEELVIRALKLFSFREDIVLDPFNGVGTTTAVAKKLSRHYVGIDVSEEYCRKAEERLKQTATELSLFGLGG